MTDSSITHVYYNPDTASNLPIGLIQERNADQTLQPLIQVTPIDQIMHNALVFAVELLRPAMGIIDQPVETNLRAIRK